jgi:hypothetical protein
MTGETFQQQCKKMWHNIDAMPKPKAEEQPPRRAWDKKK